MSISQAWVQRLPGRTHQPGTRVRRRCGSRRASTNAGSRPHQLHPISTITRSNRVRSGATRSSISARSLRRTLMQLERPAAETATATCRCAVCAFGTGSRASGRSPCGCTTQGYVATSANDRGVRRLAGPGDGAAAEVITTMLPGTGAAVAVPGPSLWRRRSNAQHRVDVRVLVGRRTTPAARIQLDRLIG